MKLFVVVAIALMVGLGIASGSVYDSDPFGRLSPTFTVNPTRDEITITNPGQAMDTTLVFMDIFGRVKETRKNVFLSTGKTVIDFPVQDHHGNLAIRFDYFGDKNDWDMAMWNVQTWL